MEPPLHLSLSLQLPHRLLKEKGGVDLPLVVQPPPVVRVMVVSLPISYYVTQMTTMPPLGLKWNLMPLRSAPLMMPWPLLSYLNVMFHLLGLIGLSTQVPRTT